MPLLVHGKEYDISTHACVQHANVHSQINALDALVIAYNAVSVLRQQTQPGDIIQSQIINGGLKPNIIHAYSSGQFVVRSATKARLDALHARVLPCFAAGATATGAKLKITPFRYYYQDHVPNHVLAATYRKHSNALGADIPEHYTAVTQASTDQGNVSHVLPSLHTNFLIPSEGEGGGPHTPDFAKAARSAQS
jgi:metal-dependent amidase/aminoacylase/carboxypeptidase family protein